VVANTPAVVKIPVIIFDIVALGWSFGILNYIDHTRSSVPWVLIAVAFLLAGMAWGVVRGLRHLGDAEFSARLGNIRRLGRWF
jgi:F0F1-type ATP synthase assembly protein I